jgi:hypothetical protein
MCPHFLLCVASTSATIRGMDAMTVASRPLLDSRARELFDVALATFMWQHSAISFRISTNDQSGKKGSHTDSADYHARMSCAGRAVSAGRLFNPGRLEYSKSRGNVPHPLRGPAYVWTACACVHADSNSRNGRQGTNGVSMPLILFEMTSSWTTCV